MGLLEIVGALWCLVGTFVWIANVWLVALARLDQRRGVSAVPLVGGVALGIGMLCFPATRAWSWIPVLVDPAGLVALMIALWMQRRSS